MALLQLATIENIVLVLTTGNTKAAPERLLNGARSVILCSYQWRKQPDSFKSIALQPKPFFFDYAACSFLPG